MYKVYGTPRSRAQRVLWMLEEIGVPYELVPAHPHSPEILSVNPSGKIPAMVVDGAVLTDSTAIMTFLGDRHGALCHPAGTVQRAQQDALTNTVIDEFDALLWSVARHTALLPEAWRVDGIAESAAMEFANNTVKLGQQLKGPFLQGEEMTLADIICAHCLRWGALMRFRIADERVQNYVRAMGERPAFGRAMGKV